MPRQPLTFQILLLVILGSSCVFAREGILTTRDGRSFSGQIRPGSNQVIVADLKNNIIHQVPITNLLGLRLTTPPPLSATTRPSQRGEPATAPAWHQTSIGSTHSPRKAMMEAGRVRLWSYGPNLSAQNDAFQFAYTELVGDGEIVCRLLRVSHPGPSMQAGLMMRDSIEPEAKHVFLALSTQGGILQSRQQNGSPSLAHSVPSLSSWLRLQRDGDCFRAYTSKNGQRWCLASKIDLKLNSKLLVGCALTGRNSTNSSRGQTDPVASCLFDQVRTGYALRHHAFRPRIHLQSGSVFAEDIAFAKDYDIHFAGAAPWPTIPFSQASQIHFQWIPTHWTKKIQAGRPGVLLTSGDFLEGDLKEISSGMCLMSTILFGLRKFDAHHEILSVVLQPPPLNHHRQISCEIITWNGSIVRGTLQSLTQQGFLLQEPVLGHCPIPFHLVKEFSWHHPA